MTVSNPTLVPVMTFSVSPDDPTHIVLDVAQQALGLCDPTMLVGTVARLQFDLLAMLNQPTEQPAPAIVRASSLPGGR